MDNDEFIAAGVEKLAEVEGQLMEALEALLTAKRESGISDLIHTEGYHRELWYAKIHGVNSKHPDQEAKRRATGQRIFPLPKQGTTEYAIMTKLNQFRAKSIDHWFPQVSYWPATDFELDDMASIVSQDEADQVAPSKLFVFHDSSEPDSEHLLVPIRYMIAGDDETGDDEASGDEAEDAPIFVEINQKWVPVERLFMKFVHGIPEGDFDSDLLSNYQSFAAVYGKRTLCFFDLPLEVREQIYDYLIPTSQVAWKKLLPEAKGRTLPRDVAIYRAFHPDPREWYPHLLLTYISRQVKHEYWMRFYSTCVIIFKIRAQLKNFFGWRISRGSRVPEIPLEYLNAARHIGFDVERYTDFFNMFGARISDDFKRIPEWEVVLLRHMKNLQEITINLSLMKPGAEEHIKWRLQKKANTLFHVNSEWFDPVLFHKTRPCQKAVADWALTAAMPFVGHVKKLNLTGCVKASQIARIKNSHEQILKVVKPAPKLTNDMVKRACRAHSKAIHAFTTAHVALTKILAPLAKDWGASNPTSRAHNHEAYDQFFKGEREATRTFYKDCSLISSKEVTDRYWISGRQVSNFPFPMMVREEVNAPACDCTVRCSEDFYISSEGQEAHEEFQSLYNTMKEKLAAQEALNNSQS